jgi:hypothetical protein
VRAPPGSGKSTTIMLDAVRAAREKQPEAQIFYIIKSSREQEWLSAILDAEDEAQSLLGKQITVTDLSNHGNQAQREREWFFGTYAEATRIIKEGLLPSKAIVILDVDLYVGYEFTLLWADLRVDTERATIANDVYRVTVSLSDRLLPRCLPRICQAFTDDYQPIQPLSVILPEPECQATSRSNIYSSAGGVSCESYVEIYSRAGGVSCESYVECLNTVSLDTADSKGPPVILLSGKRNTIQLLAAQVEPSFRHYKFIDLFEDFLPCNLLIELLNDALLSREPVMIFAPATTRIPYPIHHVTHIWVVEDEPTPAFDRETSKVSVRFSKAETERHMSMAWPSAHRGSGISQSPDRGA